MGRSGIVDAVSVGCIPVFFHAEQNRLWPTLWNASRATLLFNFTDGGSRNATAALEALVSMPSDRVAQLQEEIARIAAHLTYRGERQRRASDASDAVDVLVNALAARFESQHHTTERCDAAVLEATSSEPRNATQLHAYNCNSANLCWWLRAGTTDGRVLRAAWKEYRPLARALSSREVTHVVDAGANGASPADRTRDLHYSPCPHLVTHLNVLCSMRGCL